MDRHIKVAIHGTFYYWMRGSVAGKTVLDVGCGKGYGVAVLAETAHRVVGIDIDPDLIESSTHLCSRRNVTFLVGNCSAMPFESDSFDIVTCNAVLEYLPNFELFMEEARRILKPEGRLVCGTKNLQLSLKKSDGSPLYRNHVQEFTPADL